MSSYGTTPGISVVVHIIRTTPVGKVSPLTSSRVVARLAVVVVEQLQRVPRRYLVQE
jgi:hypothetical protein